MNPQQFRLERKQQIEKIRQPSAYCQACLGQKVEQKDFMLTCCICESSIHQTHYASQIIGKTTTQNHLIANIEEWKCQRCRYLIEKKFQVEIKCEFCPSLRGIMKKVIFEPVLNTRKEIWVHPQCTTWCHPLIYMKSKKRTHYFKEIPTGPTAKFWFRVEGQATKKCNLCNDAYGYKIKCSFYSCQKFYHITCAKRIGVVRDLQSMRFQVTSDDFCPIYCQQHLEGYVLDFANRIKLYTQSKQPQKVAHFTKVHNCYKVQLKNLTNAAKRAKQQEEIRNQLGKQMLIKDFQESSMSLSVSQPLSNQMNSSEQDSNSSTFLAFLENTYKLNDLQSLIEKKCQQKGQRKPTMKKDLSNMKPQKKVETLKYESHSQIEEEKSIQIEQENNVMTLRREQKFQLNQNLQIDGQMIEQIRQIRQSSQWITSNIGQGEQMVNEQDEDKINKDNQQSEQRSNSQNKMMAEQKIQQERIEQHAIQNRDIESSNPQEIKDSDVKARSRQQNNNQGNGNTDNNIFGNLQLDPQYSYIDDSF